MRPIPTMPSCLPASRRPEHELEAPALPPSGPHEPVPFGDSSRDVEDERPRDVGRRVGQDVRRVGDDDPARARRGDVDVVVADGDVRDDAEPVCVREQLGVHHVHEHRKQPLLALDAPEQL